MPGDRWQQLANLRTFLAYMWAHPGKQLLFMGSEFGQESEWAESRELDWWLLDNADHRGVHSLVRDMNHIYRDTAALWSLDTEGSGFQWIDANDSSNNVFSFIRFPKNPEDGPLVCVANFSALPHHDYRLGLPRGGSWTELLNTDADAYAGSGVGNLGVVKADLGEHHGQPASASLTIPPLATLWLRPS
jgi:1,4-alpha-glucan branching enzyme